MIMFLGIILGPALDGTSAASGVGALEAAFLLLCFLQICDSLTHRFYDAF